MSRRAIRRMGLAVCLVVLFWGLSEAQAGVFVQVERLGDPAPSLQNFLVRLFSSGSPIEAVGAIQINGEVHQANQFSGTVPTPTPFVNSLPSSVLAYDTHLLLPSYAGWTTGSSIVETNDRSNPGGLSNPPWQFGVGTFGQGADGLLTLQPEYQSTNLNLLQVVLEAGSFATLSGVAVSGGVSYPFSFTGALPDDWISFSQESVDFGPTRVGTTATRVISACVQGTPPIGDATGVFSTWGEAFGPASLVCEPYCDIPCTFSPPSRGDFEGGADLQPYSWEIAGGYASLSGKGVGPVFGAELATGATLDFGDHQVDSFFDVFFDVSNLTTDAELGDLTKLTIAASIEGDTAEAFEIIGAAMFELFVGQTKQVHLRLNTAGRSPGDYQAQLVLRTDAGAAAGATGAGEAHAFTLHGTVVPVPEPSVFVGLIGLLLAGALSCRRVLARSW